MTIIPAKAGIQRLFSLFARRAKAKSLDSRQKRAGMTGTSNLRLNFDANQEVPIYTGDNEFDGCGDAGSPVTTHPGNNGVPPGGTGPVGVASIPSESDKNHASNCVTANGGKPATKPENYNDKFKFRGSNGTTYVKSTRFPNSPDDTLIPRQTSVSSTTYFGAAWIAGLGSFTSSNGQQRQTPLTAFEQLIWTMAHERIHQSGDTNHDDSSGGYYDTKAYQVVKSLRDHGNGTSCSQ